MLEVNINMKNRERIAIAQKLGQPDQVPIDFSLASQFNYLHGWLGLDGRRFFLDPTYVLEAQLKFINKFKIEGTLGPVFGLAIDPTYFGAADIIIRKDTSPWVHGHLDTVERLNDFLKNYKEPDPWTAGNFPLSCNSYAYFKNVLGDKIGAPMGMLGPIDICCSICGQTNFFIFAKTEPVLAHSLLEKVTDFMIKNIAVRDELFKPDNHDFSLYDDFCAFFNRDDFLEFAYPYIKKVWDAYTDKDSIRQFHCDSPLDHVVDLLPEMGVNVLLMFDPKNDIGFFKEKIGDRVCLKGNINPLKFLRFGTPETIKAEVKRQLDAAMKGGGYIISTGGEMADGTPDENIFALIEAVEEYGKY
ncbi:MAG: uroporphyrinogen decarboxylase family protein [Candidatus Humimicrobiaceae bacterium]